MNMKLVRRGRGFLALALYVSLVSTTARVAQADIIPVASADQVGARAANLGNQSQITLPQGTGANYTAFTMHFAVSFDGALWTYQYNLSWLGVNTISHFSLATSPGFDEANVFGGTTPGPLDFGVVDQASDNPIPTDLSGVKFDFGGEPTFSKTYFLVTDKSPVWGSFFAKVGSAGGAYNSGWTPTNGPLQIDPATFDKSKWVPVPDTLTPTAIPEPSSIVMASLGGLGAVVLVVRRRRRRS